MTTRALSALVAGVAVLTIAHFPRDADDISSPNTWLERPDYRTFYDRLHDPADDPAGSAPGATEADPQVVPVTAFVRRYGLERARVLEVGAGAGSLQDVVTDYTGLDVSAGSRRYFHKPFVQASATQMPFPSGRFDAIWTIYTLEHVPQPEQALNEIRRVLRDKGLLYLRAAWHSRPWAASGLHVRPYSDLTLPEQATKLSIPVRESVAFRALYTFPIRLLRLSASLAGPTAFRYQRLVPNYERYWDADSDAMNSMDPYEAVLWFTSRGDDLLEFEGVVAPLFVRSGTLVIRINKSAND